MDYIKSENGLAAFFHHRGTETQEEIFGVIGVE